MRLFATYLHTTTARLHLPAFKCEHAPSYLTDAASALPPHLYWLPHPYYLPRCHACHTCRRARGCLLAEDALPRDS